MTALVISEHDNSELKGATLNTISAALQLDEEIHVLVAGSTVTPLLSRQLRQMVSLKSFMLILLSMRISLQRIFLYL